MNYINLMLKKNIWLSFKALIAFLFFEIVLCFIISFLTYSIQYTIFEISNFDYYISLSNVLLIFVVKSAFLFPIVLFFLLYKIITSKSGNIIHYLLFIEFINLLYLLVIQGPSMFKTYTILSYYWGTAFFDLISVSILLIIFYYRYKSLKTT